MNVSFVGTKDPGVGANQNIYKEAQKNSPGYDMYNDGHRRGIFIKMNGIELQGKVNFQFVSNEVIKYFSKIYQDITLQDETIWRLIKLQTAK